VLRGTYDNRDDALLCVDWRGDQWDGDPRSAVQSPANTDD
jgi:hypothetical protein